MSEQDSFELEVELGEMSDVAVKELLHQISQFEASRAGAFLNRVWSKTLLREVGDLREKMTSPSTAGDAIIHCGHWNVLTANLSPGFGLREALDRAIETKERELEDAQAG